MTPEEEEAEIIRNARAAHKAGKIDKWQLWDVYRLVGEAQAEREMKCQQDMFTS